MKAVFNFSISLNLIICVFLLYFFSFMYPVGGGLGPPQGESFRSEYYRSFPPNCLCKYIQLRRWHTNVFCVNLNGIIEYCFLKQTVRILHFRM